MTQIFADNGKVVPCTVVSAGPVTVTRIKQKPNDNADKVQVGFGVRPTKNTNKAQVAANKALATDEKKTFRWLKEFPNAEGKWQVGDKIDASVFEAGDHVKVSGINKAKGFQGVVKRHGFHGGRRSHGQKHSEREPGSIGATAPQRVFKGVRMAGRMGGKRTTLGNLEIARVDTENNLILIKGAIPGRRGTLLEIVAK